MKTKSYQDRDSHVCYINKLKSNLLIMPSLLVLFHLSVLIPRFNSCLFFSLPKQLPSAEGLKLMWIGA